MVWPCTLACILALEFRPCNIVTEAKRGPEGRWRNDRVIKWKKREWGNAQWLTITSPSELGPVRAFTNHALDFLTQQASFSGEGKRQPWLPQIMRGHCMSVYVCTYEPQRCSQHQLDEGCILLAFTKSSIIAYRKRHICLVLCQTPPVVFLLLVFQINDGEPTVAARQPQNLTG